MRRVVTCLLLPALAAPAAVFAQEAPLAARVIRGMRYPSLSPDGSRIAFSYRGDLWTVPVSGGEAKRVAELPGFDARPRWSPDSQTLAYSSDVNNNFDLFTIPAAGGTPKRVTFHTGDDLMADWSPDGKELLFYASRETRFPTLYTLRLADGRLRQLTQDEQVLQTPTYAPDGKTIAYVRGSAPWARKGYRGSANGEVYTLSLEKPGEMPHRLTQSPLHDLWPMFSADGKWIYYVTDPDGTSNLYRMPAKGGKSTVVTRQKEGYLHYPAISRDGKKVVYETDFSLWTVDLTAKAPVAPQRLTVTAAVEDKPRTEERKVTSGANEMEVSPDGSQVAVGVRGDIYLVPAAGGDARRLTDSLARDYDFSWSPDGRWLAYASERDANVDVYLVDVTTGATKRVTTDPQPDVAPTFSPDGRKLAFQRGANGKQLVTVPVAGGPEKVVVDSAFLGEPRWSPDGRWLAYSKRTLAAITNVYVAPSEGGAEINVSKWSDNNFSPVWSPDGARLSFLSTRSGSPELFTVELSRKTSATATIPGTAALPVAVNPVSIDAAGIERRVKQLVSQPAGAKTDLIYAPGGKECYFTVFGPGGGALYSVPVAGGAAKKVQDGMGPLTRLTADGSAVFTLAGGLVKKVVLASGAVTPVPFSAAYTADLKEERRQAFDQAWRMMRDYFYDGKMHGTDWNAIRARYRPIVDETASAQEFHLLLTELIGELNASHTGAMFTNPPKVASETAALGLTFDLNAEGPGLKVASVLRDGPTDQDDTRIQPGEYVLAIGGKDVSPTEAAWETLAGKADQPLELLVNGRPDKNGARTVKLVPASRARLTDLLYEDLVETNRERVDKLSDGKLAYLHIKSMDQPSLQRFERELLTLAYEKEGVVLDVRNNPGGRIHDDLFALLTRKVHVYETPRDALKMTQPFGAFTHPSVLLINGGSFSDAEIFSNGYRANGLGRIVGVPTGGGVIGTGNVPLLDGVTTFRVPRTGWHTLDGRNLENWGVPPDLYVEYLPEDVLANRDPQLETAVKDLLKRVKK